MIIPVRTDSPLRSTPWVNWLLIASNIVVFLLQQSHLNDRHGNPPGMLDPGNLKLYAYFSYAFLHADAWHIAGNMLFLYIFGNNVNDKMGNFGYLAFYLAGGVFAGMMHVMTSNNPVLGASGAVAAVTGAYLVLLPRSNITIFYLFIFIGTFEIASMYFILFSFAWDLINSFARETNVAHYAHYCRGTSSTSWR
jgi:membrane associated rhomboid family serine protease